jgi:hypothetical protein
MASSSKKRTTMAKLARENKLRERRLEKQARKDARKQAAAEPGSPEDSEVPAWGEDDPAAAESVSGTPEA